ncbi:MAG: type II toxin-antitoxin system Phd/YefM family antitoxin [Deltaproteobacteria bacterium]|nr:type II toxin-antitoxin system Phd/YefM family antitoxin [Deltaproteobacteria bacterium]
MQHVGIRELKNGLSRYLSLVSRGERLVVTDRGTAVAVIHSPGDVEKDAPVEEKLFALAATGAIKLLARGKKRDLRTKPVPIRGKPISETMLEDRR